MKKLVLLLLFGWLISGEIAAQKHNFRNYGLREGLPQSVVYAILQDNKGYIWFGTQSGVCRFDGKKFENFDAENGLADNFVKAIYQDKDLNLWFGTVNGLTRFDGKNFRSFTTKDGLPSNQVTSIFHDKKHRMWVTTTAGVASFDGQKFTTYNAGQGLSTETVFKGMCDRQGNLWFGTKGGGVFKFNGKTFQQFTTENGLPHNIVFSCHQDSKGNLWFGTLNGAAKYDGVTFEVLTTENGLTDNLVAAICEDASGSIWLGTKNGVTKINYHNIQQFKEENGLPNNAIFSIKEDRQGDIWFGTRGGGVSKLVLSNSTTGESRFLLYKTEHGIVNNVIRSLAEDARGNMWFATENGLSRMYAKNGKSIFENFTIENGLRSNFLLSLLPDSQGVWFSSQEGLSYTPYADKVIFRHFSVANGLPDASIRAMTYSSRSTLWLATSAGLVSVKMSEDRTKILKVRAYGKKEGISANYVASIFMDSEKRLWAGTDGGGLCKILLENDTIAQIQVYNKESGLPDNMVFAITEDEYGKIWIGTGAGVVKINPESKNSRKAIHGIYGKKQGLQSQGTWLIAAANDGAIWVGHEKGIERLDPETGLFRYYGYSEGFTPIETNQSAICRDTQGNLWFGTMDGAMRYNPIEDMPNKIPPTVHITDIKLFRKTVDWRLWTDSLDNYFHLPTKLKLPHHQNYITFDFMGIHLNVPEKVQYKFMLEGFDKDWSPMSYETSATYTNLSFGQYTFLVKAANSDGVWTPVPTKFVFEIEQPFWRKWWYYALLVSVSMGAAILLARKKLYPNLVLMLGVIAMLLLVEALGVRIATFGKTFWSGSAPMLNILVKVLVAWILVWGQRKASLWFKKMKQE